MGTFLKHILKFLIFPSGKENVHFVTENTTCEIGSASFNYKKIGFDMKIPLWTRNNLSTCQHAVYDPNDEGFLLSSFSPKSLITTLLVSCNHRIISRFAEEITYA